MAFEEYDDSYCDLWLLIDLANLRTFWEIVNISPVEMWDCWGLFLRREIWEVGELTKLFPMNFTDILKKLNFFILFHLVCLQYLYVHSLIDLHLFYSLGLCIPWSCSFLPPRPYFRELCHQMHLYLEHYYRTRGHWNPAGEVSVWWDPKSFPIFIIWGLKKSRWQQDWI